MNRHAILSRIERGLGADLAAFAAGALLPLAFAPTELYPLAVILPAFLFWLWLKAASAREALRRGLAFGLGLFGVGISWVYVAIHVYGESPVLVAALITLALVLIMSAYPALCGYLAWRLRQRWGIGDTAAVLLLYPVLWLIAELLRGWLFTGFPWLELGYSQIDSPLRGLAPLVGVNGITLVVVFSAGVLCAVSVLPLRRWLAVLVPAILLWGGAALMAGHTWTQPTGKPIRVVLIQGNLSQITKWDTAQIAGRLNTYASLTLENLDNTDLIIWPENAITVFYHQLKDDYFAWLLQETQAAGVDVVLGVPLLDADGEHYYTTLMKLDKQPSFYKKHHLVPFGEFVPFEGLIRGLIDFFDLPMSSFSPGPAEQPPLKVAGQAAGVTVCYEDLFVEEVVHSLPEATLLINGSNNAWYGDSLAPHQHLQISRMRALETGRPLLRATTNGISAFVDAQGRIRARSAQFQQQVLKGTIQPMQGLTPYVRWGEWPLRVLLLGLLGGVFLGARRRAGQVLPG